MIALEVLGLTDILLIVTFNHLLPFFLILFQGTPFLRHSGFGCLVTWLYKHHVVSFNKGPAIRQALQSLVTGTCHLILFLSVSLPASGILLILFQELILVRVWGIIGSS